MSRMKPTTLYRFLTGPDDAKFCHRVSEALSKGWMLYGPPSLTFDAEKKTVICGQAVIKDVDDVEYSPNLQLGEH
jgi:hypothetical protein